MSVIAEFRVQSSGFVLSQALDAVPDVELEVVQEVGTDADRPYLFIWVSGEDFDRFESAMAADPTVEDVERYIELETQVLYRLRISEETDIVTYSVWVEVGADQLEARYVDGWWYNRYRFPDREALSEVREWCDEVGVEFDLTRVYTDDAEPGSLGLTEPQREVLRVGYELGYFEVPREATVSDIADELDISGQAVSERLRRGHRTLVGQSLPNVDPP
ncbi:MULTISPECIES: helix-turn-helix domain-containing protein [Salinibaculum]|uniref:helix-turn-helix domain-containing protein n=1 Tax=Salinibaculum TaxID=2732368 RepID=UPI0030CE9BBB